MTADSTALEITALETELFDEMDRLESAEPVDADAAADLDVRIWVDGPGQPEGRAPAWIRDAVRAWDRALFAPNRVTGTAIRLSPRAAARLDELTCPVLAIGGTLDVTDVAATAAHLAATVPGARSVPGARARVSRGATLCRDPSHG